MILQIPITAGDINWEQETILEGITYRLGFWYSQLEDCYYLHIGDPNAADGSWIVSSMKLQTNQPLLRHRAGLAANSCAQQGRAAIWPPGEMQAVSTTPDNSIATLGELGARVVLLYATSDDPSLTGG